MQDMSWMSGEVSFRGINNVTGTFPLHSFYAFFVGFEVGGMTEVVRKELKVW